MSNIMFVYNQFKEFRRTVGSTDAHWADFTCSENGTSTSVVLVSGDTGNGFPSRSLRVSIAST